MIEHQAQAPTSDPSEDSNRHAVLSMSLCVAMLIAAEFMPVSLLTPIAGDFHAINGVTGRPCLFT